MGWVFGNTLGVFGSPFEDMNILLWAMALVLVFGMKNGAVTIVYESPSPLSLSLLEIRMLQLPIFWPFQMVPLNGMLILIGQPKIGNWSLLRSFLRHCIS
ncbi:hypothetical protein I3843_06G164700 [Carya illinoinensis]|nr:hypothetical protein I3843_06G164700 [Carya illinoinensis]